MLIGSIILAELRQANNTSKLRPALVLGVLPPYNDLLICGISTQLHQEVEGFDEILQVRPKNGLKATSLIRLGMLFVLPENLAKGRIGSIPEKLRKDLLNRLHKQLI